MQNHLLAVLLCLSLIARLQAAGLDDLTTDITWTEKANGVWSAELGNLAKETRYTDLAAAAPKLDQINALFPKEPFPFAHRKIRFRITKDHMVVVHIPADVDEKVFGYGLQFDATRKNGQNPRSESRSLQQRWRRDARSGPLLYLK